MKNLYLLQTSKPTRLRIGNNGNFVIGVSQNATVSKNDSFTNQNIYITSDDEIKEGDWFYLDDAIIVAKYINVKPVKDAQKIILTTDQDLIKDGVQAIDDEFLEWFVKNPSYEWVELITDSYTMRQIIELKLRPDILKYNIIIPKEEHKQETLHEAAKSYAKIPLHRDVDTEERYFNDSVREYDAFIDGAKWQSERSYSEEEVLDILRKSHSIEKDSKMESWIIRRFEQYKK